MDADHRDEEDRLGMPTGAATRSTATTMPPHELQYTHHAHDQRNPPNRALFHLHTHGELPTEAHADYSHDRLDTPDELHHNAHTAHQQTSPTDARFNAYADPPYLNPADPATLVKYTDGGGASRHAHAEVTADDDFYRDFQGACYERQPSETDYMATSSTSASRARELSSLRSNANGTTPRHPVVSSARGVHRPSTRSVSAPIDEVASRINSTSRQSSVKDLTRRFDDKASTAIPRPPVRTGIPTRQNRSATSGDRPSPTTNGNNTQTSYAALRTSVDRNLPTDPTRPGFGTRGTQRPRFFAEDQMSNNSQSFASRIGKPRNGVSVDARAPRSSSNLSPKISPTPPPVAQANASASQGLLFGEILPDHRGSHMVGHGIEGSGARPRRTSESSARPARLVMHQRTLSDPEMLEPSSPSDWYRVDVPSKQLYQPLHLDDAPVSDDLLRQLPATTSITRKSQPGAKDRIQTVSTSSKLPLSVRKLASPTPSTSTSSPSGENSRANSPFDPKRQTGIPRHTTTTSSRAKTPTRRAPSRGAATPSDTTRLNAHVAAPASGLSPSLRSSRPRQSVASATTASSRSRMAGRTRSPASRGTSKAPEPTRRRKISVGPVDFEQRREHIRLAYSKSIRDNQARTARREAAEKRKKEMETASRAKAAALAAAQANGDPTPSEALPSQEQQPDAKAQEPLRVLTTHQSNPKVVTSPASSAKDSPTLGIPGSFPVATPPVDIDETPLSAVSVATEATEFDTEPQTLPGFPAWSDQGSTGLGVSVPGSAVEYQDHDVVSPPSLGKDLESHEGVLHMSNLEEEHLAEEGDRVSIKISLDESLPFHTEQPASEPVATQEQARTTVLGTDTEEYEPTPYASPSLETTVRILRRESDQEMTNERSSLSPSMYDYEEPEYQVKLDRNAARAIRKFARPEDETLPHSYGAVPAASHDQFHGYERGTNTATEIQDRFLGGDPDALDNIQHESYASQQQSPDASHSLLVPTLPAPANRYSQQSTWTDFSLDSAPNSESETRAADYRQGPLHPPNPPFASDSRYSFTPSGSSSARQSEHFSADMSPHDTSDGHFSVSSRELQLPELDTGAGFSVPYISRRASRLGSQDPSDIPYPDHEPPPLPTAYNTCIGESYRPPSSAYQPGTRPGSTLVGSRRESEDFPPNTSTPHSVDHMSLEARESSLGGQTSVDSDQKSLQTAEAVLDGEVLDKKERHRLQQRRNVIRELVDTEMVFVRDMNIVEEIYKGTAEACPRLDDKTVKLVFRNVDEIVALHTTFCAQLKEAVTSVYMPQGRREESIRSDSAGSNALPQNLDPDDSKDRSVLIGPLFRQNMDAMKSAHEGFLRNSDHAAKRLIQIQQDPTVKVWLNECHEVAKDLTAAWDLDSLLIKPMQRITKYPNLIITLLQHTPPDHPDRSDLMSAKEALETAIIDINKTKKNFELVGQIVGRKRKESDVKAGFARAFGKRVDKLQASNARVPEDAVYTKLHEKFGDDYLRLQVVLRDVEFYTRQISAYVHEFLKYLSSMELVMRLQPGSYPELESKWVQFNVSMRDIEKVALDQHVSCPSGFVSELPSCQLIADTSTSLPRFGST